MGCRQDKTETISLLSPPFPASFHTSDTPTAPHWLLTLAALCSYHLETMFLLLDHLLLPLDLTLWFFGGWLRGLQGFGHLAEATEQLGLSRQDEDGVEA